MSAKHTPKWLQRYDFVTSDTFLDPIECCARGFCKSEDVAQLEAEVEKFADRHEALHTELGIQGLKLERAEARVRELIEAIRELPWGEGQDDDRLRLGGALHYCTALGVLRAALARSEEEASDV